MGRNIRFILRLSLLCFLFCSIISAEAQHYYLRGKVTNTRMEPLAYVNVQVKGVNASGTYTDVAGNYVMKLVSGQYEIVYSFVGYKTQTISVVINEKDAEQDMIMETEAGVLDGVKVSSKKVDRSEEIIRNAINAKETYLYPFGFSSDAYIKATEETEVQKSKHKAKSKPDTAITGIPRLNMAEINLTRYIDPPNKLKEIRNGVTRRGDIDGLFYLRTTDGDFNFYHNMISVPALSESPFLSPISNSGLVAYKYRMLDIYYEDGHKIFKIKVIPGKLGNALVSGEIDIIDSLWCIKRLNLKMPKYHLVEYDEFIVKQEHEFVKDSAWMVTSQEFIYKARAGKAKYTGRTAVYFSNFMLNRQYPKKFFNNEVSATSLEAYKRDSSYWNSLRKEPLNDKEMRYIRYTDSIKAAHSKKEYLDSVDGVFNKITFRKLVFVGQGYYNREKEKSVFYAPLIFAYQPIQVGGARLNYWISYYKKFKNKKSISLTPSLSYGFNNQDIKGDINVGRLYDPFRQGYISVSAGSDFEVINPYDAWIRIFRRSNFYRHDYLSGFHRIELVNGLYLQTGFEFANRQSISDYKFNPLADSLLGEVNQALSFESYKAFYTDVTLSYTHRQKYIREPYEKVVMGSKFPTVSVRYRKGIPMAFGSTIDFDYLEYLVNQEFKIGLAGISRYNFTSGKFLNQNDLRYVDYKFQRRAGPIFFTNPLHSFQGLDTTYATFKRYYEFHYLHKFNGAVLNKIPLLKKLNLMEVAGCGFLVTQERNLRYIEGFVGVEKLVRLWKERFKIGVYAVFAESNRFNYTPSLKFTIEYFNRRTNTWSY